MTRLEELLRARHEEAGWFYALHKSKKIGRNSKLRVMASRLADLEIAICKERGKSR